MPETGLIMVMIFINVRIVMFLGYIVIFRFVWLGRWFIWLGRRFVCLGRWFICLWRRFVWLVVVLFRHVNFIWVFGLGIGRVSGWVRCRSFPRWIR